jgi:hypothetical protein
MALTGSIRDFGLSEILQLIGQQKKSGALEVQDKTRRVEILFDQGNIVGVKLEPYDERYDLGAMLTRSGLISRSQLVMARKEERESLKPLEQVLLNARALDLDELKATVTLAQLETIYSLFLWKDGDYSFEARPVTYPQQWTSPIGSEHVLMDGYRIKDEWPLIEKVIPDYHLRLEKLAGEFGPDDRLRPDQDKIYRLVDGQRTVEDLAFLARVGRFETMKVLRELIENGRIRTVGAVARPVVRNLTVLALRAVIALAVLLGALGTALGVARNLERLAARELDRPGVRAQAALLALYQGDRIKRALDVHAALHGAFPPKLDDLVGAGELGADALHGPFAFRYQPAADGYRLSAQPPAGASGP